MNQIITLYNETLCVRIAVESLIFYWKHFWEYGKFAVRNLGDLFLAFGKMITNIFDPEERKKAWKELTNSLSENIQLRIPGSTQYAKGK